VSAAFALTDALRGDRFEHVFSVYLFPEDGCLQVYGIGEDGVKSTTKEPLEEHRTRSARPNSALDRGRRCRGRLSPSTSLRGRDRCSPHRILSNTPDRGWLPPINRGRGGHRPNSARLHRGSRRDARSSCHPRRCLDGRARGIRRRDRNSSSFPTRSKHMKSSCHEAKYLVVRAE
jgi:hypothetical protein